uniref:Transthyretin-like protein 46 n=1 Tax=Romanomermis culicivorax TaxID=13658 RepID=A0A915HUR1_ROMCU
MLKVTFVIFVFCILFSSQTHGGLIGRKQKVSARGRFVCGDKPAADVLVKLVDVDTGTIDDKMDEKRTNRNGEFSVSGEETELTDIDPILKIYHDCNKGTLMPKKVEADGTEVIHKFEQGFGYRNMEFGGDFARRIA